MKTAKPFSSDFLSSRRAQPVRQTRTNPPRSSGLLSRPYGSRDASGGGLNGGPVDDQQMEIFPAITHFADAITALPKELARHFTLLKEVDAKIFAPEEKLGQLIDAALNCPPLDRRQNPEALQITAPTSVHTSAPGSINGSIVNGQNNSLTSAADVVDIFDPANTAWDPENIPRRTVFRHCVFTMQEMLVSLDEKNHVISTATEALDKQLARLDDCFPHIEHEISEEARYGSLTHWAYVENRLNKPNERSRRDAGATNHSNAAGADEAAARSEARKQAMLAKKSGRSHHVDSDFDDHIDGRHKGEFGKKSHGNSKKGRPAESTVGLGITNGADLNGNQASKRRKVDRGVNGGATMERSMSGVYSNNGNASKGKMNSPRETPVPEGSKKKKTSILPNGQSKKRTFAVNSNAMSPMLASSPIHNTFAESKAGSRSSPAPTNGSRPTTSRARQNSTQSIVDSAKQRPSSSASNRANGSAGGAADLSSVATLTGRSVMEVKTSMKDSGTNSKGEHLIEDAAQEDPEMRGGLLVGNRKDSNLKREDAEINGDVMQNLQSVAATIVTTKSGRASKPSTPAIPTFPEPVRSRSGRNVLEQAGNAKRSHKKGAGQAAQLMAMAADDDASSSMLGDDEDQEVDADEPTYCYCNGVSYGEMVACDADGCAKEWFHLDCVGLKVAPKGNAKWYCDDCKENMKNGGKRFNGR